MEVMIARMTIAFATGMMEAVSAEMILRNDCSLLNILITYARRSGQRDARNTHKKNAKIQNMKT